MWEVSAMLAFTDGDAWRLGIGDPTVMGWLTVLAYFTTALLCWCEARRAKRFKAGVEKVVFWGTLTALLVLLGFNKQLDLQTLLTLTGRRIAIAQGWYDNRKIVQLFFLASVAIGGVISMLIMRRLVARHADLRLPLLGFVVLLAFVIIRAASFHHVDQLINFRVSGVRMNWVLELGAIVLVAIGANKGRVAEPDGLATAQ